MLHFFREMLSDGRNISSIRVLATLTCVSILAVYIAQNVSAIVRHEAPVDFTGNAVFILGIALGAKVGQHVSEKITIRSSKSQKPK